MKFSLLFRYQFVFIKFGSVSIADIMDVQLLLWLSNTDISRLSIINCSTIDFILFRAQI